MLKISSIKIDGLAEGCVTDSSPRISFSLESDLPGESLSYAEITCGDWKVKTTDQINNIYGGAREPFSTYDVYIHAFGTSGESAEAAASFQTGRLNTPWQGEWITDTGYEIPKDQSPQPMTFKRGFKAAGPVRRAWINATALGIYELMLNGKKVGEDYFSPGFTSYAHQIQYQTYDVTTQLEENNELIAVVGGGWAVGSFTHTRKSKIYADRQALLLELHILYEDGRRETVVTDNSWELTFDGPYRMAEWYDGETYDATIELQDAEWKKAGITKLRSAPQIVAQYGLPVRRQQTMTPVFLGKAPSGELIYDFGQNFAGVISAKIKGKRGQSLTFRHAEVLVDGELFVKSLRSAKATATYICRDEEEYSPRLTYMGFRYAGVSGIEASDIELSAYVLHSDFEEIGSFTCSNEMINRLQENIRWGGKSNFVDIPTDCPQRDEREGWTGDIAVFAQTAAYNFDMSRFFEKWLRDMRAEQGSGGGIPMVIPRAANGFPPMASSCWGDSCVLVPWAEYLARGDRRLLEKQYPAIQKYLKAVKWWAGFLSFTPNTRHIWRLPYHWGDWCAPGENIRQWLAKTKWVATAYYANSCALAAQIAQILSKDEDAQYYLALRGKIVRAYREVFTDGKGRLKKEFQTAYVLPLHFGMTQGAETKAMAENLARLVRENGGMLSTGFTGTPYLLFALSDNGQEEAAFDLLLQTKCPSWLYEVKAGGTTIWERWDALRADGTVNIGGLNNPGKEAESGGMVSFNHYANGAVGDWLYRRVAGIEPISGGYKQFKISPLIGGGISAAKGSTLTPYGEIVSDWHISDGVFNISVRVPVSAHCELQMPNGERHELESGEYTFVCGMEA